MIIFVMSDTHDATDDVVRHAVAEAQKRKAELIVHCGDIVSKHVSAELFAGLPVVCAITKDQINEKGEVKKGFEQAPSGWVLTRPGSRTYSIGESEYIYVGHHLSFEFLMGSEELLERKLQEIRDRLDGVRWLFSGHTHHQIYKQGPLISFINPGAMHATYSVDGYEFAVVDTRTREVVFGRIPSTKPSIPTFSIGVISDSLNISGMDSEFWGKLAKEFVARDVRTIIHCGNIDTADIGRSEFAEFTIHYMLRQDQWYDGKPENWKQIDLENPVIEVSGYKFYVQLDLGADLLGQSERDMKKLCLTLRRKHSGISFVLCGFTNDAFYEEGEEVRIVNPGDILKDRNFAVICLPRTEITFGHVPLDPLPEIR